MPLTVLEDLGLLGETAASAEARGGRGERWDEGPSSLQKPLRRFTQP